VRTLLAIAVLTATAGCSGGLHSSVPATQVYVLRAAVPAAQSDPGVNHGQYSVRVGRPMAAPGLGSDHIVLVQSDHRMSYFVASRWPAVLPELVEEMTVDSLRASGAWSTVQDSSSAFSGEYILQIVIRRFEADYTDNANTPSVHVVLDCTVGRRAGREILASFVAEGSATAGANRLTEVMTAFDTASNQALADITGRAARIVQQDTSKTSQNVETPVPSITR
jgi:cholesterol transport system auxiliary component